jgi:hypothetical protein
MRVRAWADFPLLGPGGEVLESVLHCRYRYHEFGPAMTSRSLQR